MKLVRADENQFHFEITLEEQVFLFHLLHQYPLVPAEYPSLSRPGDARELAENQQLLQESLRADRRTNRQQILALMKEPGRFVPAQDENNLRVSFTRGEIEWLLQICNDIRIGSWVALGSPDLDDKAELGKEPATAKYLINMEIAGAFEMLFIHATTGEPGLDDEAADHSE